MAKFNAMLPIHLTILFMNMLNTYKKWHTFTKYLFLLLLTFNVSHADTTKLLKSHSLKHSLSIKNENITFENKNFILQEDTVLQIENSIINITISPKTNFFVQLNGGKLILKNNTFNVSVIDIPSVPNDPSLYYLIKIITGNVEIAGNKFNIDKPYTVGLLQTDIEHDTSGFILSGNTINNFHGGFYLLNNSNTTIRSNIFTNVSFSNILNMGYDNTICDNTFLFSGNFKFGNAIDILDAAHITISGNTIASSSSYGITLIDVEDVKITDNNIIDSLSYGIYITTLVPDEFNKKYFLNKKLMKFKAKRTGNKDILIVNNSFSQNRYGLSGNNITNLTVTDNLFIQRFIDDETRIFWTNNDNLLADISNMIWQENLYKEAYSQEVPGDNSKSQMVVEFPIRGGVIF